MALAAVLTDENHQIGMQGAVFDKGPGIFENRLVQIAGVDLLHRWMPFEVSIKSYDNLMLVKFARLVKLHLEFNF
jgi:hypothetical protein